MLYSEKVMKYFRHPKNVGEIKNADGVGKAGNPMCLLPGELVQKNAGLNAINEIEINDKVLGHDGNFHPVEKIFKRQYSGQIIEIKNRFGVTCLTPEHETLVIKVPKKHYFLYLRNKQKLKPAWYHAGELRKGDLVLYPITKKVMKIEHIPVSSQKLKFDFRSKFIPNTIEINGDFLKLCGYYLAEGCLEKTITRARLSFAFSIDKEKYADDVISLMKKIFEINAVKRINTAHHTITVTVNSVMVVRLFKKIFGERKAGEKEIPEWMLFLEPTKQKSLIAGLWLGNRFVNFKKLRAEYVTVSTYFCNQLKILLLRQGVVPSIYVKKEKVVKGTKHRKVFCIHLDQRDTLKLAEIIGIQLKLSREERNKAWCDGDFAYIPVTNISKKEYNGLVYNLMVSDSHSYATNSCTVHNCGDIMWLYIKVRKNRIVDIKFRTMGCAAAIATSSMITELAKGKTIEQAMEISNKDVAGALGGLPPIKHHCSLLAEDALSEAIYDYFLRNTLPVPKKLVEKHKKALLELERIEKIHAVYAKAQEEAWKLK